MCLAVQRGDFGCNGWETVRYIGFFSRGKFNATLLADLQVGFIHPAHQ